MDMQIEKLKALAEHLDIDIAEIELSADYGSWTEYKTPEGMFNVMTTSEAQSELQNDVKAAVLKYGFKESGGWYDEAIQWAIIDNCLDNDKLLNYNITNEGRESFDLGEFAEIFEHDKNVIDFEKVAELVSSWEDYGHFLASYDGETNYAANGLLVFKQTDTDDRSPSFLKGLSKQSKDKSTVFVDR